MALVKTEALVVKVGDYSESTRLVTLFSPRWGKIRVLARGAKRLKSRERGSLEPFSRIEALVYRKDPAALGTLRESAVVETFPELRGDYDRWLLASLVFEVIDRATVPSEDLGALYHRVCAYLDEMRSAERPLEATIGVLAAMLGLLGFRPRLDSCGLCGREASLAGFRADLCSAVCSKCAGGSKYFRPMPPGTLRAFGRLAGFEGGAKVRLSAKQTEQLFDALVEALQYHLDITLSSARMIETADLRRMARAGGGGGRRREARGER